MSGPPLQPGRALGDPAGGAWASRGCVGRGRPDGTWHQGGCGGTGWGRATEMTPGTSSQNGHPADRHPLPPAARLGRCDQRLLLLDVSSAPCLLSGPRGSGWCPPDRRGKPLGERGPRTPGRVLTRGRRLRRQRKRARAARPGRGGHPGPPPPPGSPPGPGALWRQVLSTASLHLRGPPVPAASLSPRPPCPRGLPVTRSAIS